MGINQAEDAGAAAVARVQPHPRIRSWAMNCGRCESSSADRRRPSSLPPNAAVRSPRRALPSCSPAPARKPRSALRSIRTCFGMPAVTPWQTRAWIREHCRPIWVIDRSIRRRGTLRLHQAGSKTDVVARDISYWNGCSAPVRTIGRIRKYR